ncbi:chemotaxis protein CheW [Sulfurimonas sp.]|uniref:chemotaxis protein CheW n=1 Tax=Sulfurimonas sp. TaxID=2022749 RepID=UPI002B474F41|nr:chemotaxis protein CheW [Sulfurimonas sp.]
MKDLIVFSVGDNRYALDIENIQRIIQMLEISEIPNAHNLIDGMMSYEGKVIKVINFRKLIGLLTYDEELVQFFYKLKKSHQVWIDALESSIKNASTFTKQLDPNKCELGIWLNSFNSYDDKDVEKIFKHLYENHKKLHLVGANILKILKEDKDKAIEEFNKNIYDIFTKTIDDIDSFISKADKVTNSLQKLIIYENNDKVFAVKVDKIEDIAHIEDGDIMSNEDDSNNIFLELLGVLELDDMLINIIKTIKIPS